MGGLPIDLIKRIPGVEVIVLDLTMLWYCRGTYGFKSENYDVAQGIGAGLFRQIEESGCDLVITDCETCKWQIEMSTTKNVNTQLAY